ncbi:hypothetical protein [Methylosinus sp. PW1]|uniref:hypothetical protein n=1 Tax=Methylosinus sp. PW1 TaxID=107636 RepID=UPI00056D8CF4|nr:hypothetical protein [Methylosinus sp. PW1]
MSTPTEAAKSIVGKWGSDGEACEFAAMSIGRMEISSPELKCRFNSVSRSGETVTWKGICDRAFGASLSNATVTARSYNDGDRDWISLRVNGGAEHDFLRCP